MDANGATRDEIVIIAAGGVTVIGAFLPFWDLLLGCLGLVSGAVMLEPELTHP